jgi:hypothetical protein
MIAVQLLLRGWVVYGNWFFFDDFVFVSRAHAEPLTPGYLFEPYAGHLMPAAFLVTWLATRADPLNWTVMATIILVAQAVASYGCWRMLRILFGDRRLNLIWLAVYLFSPVTLAAYIWWAAAVNQLPFQIAFFFGIASHVTYLRTRRIRHAFAAAGWLLFGLAFYEKTALLIVVYAFVALGYFASGSLFGRVRKVLARYWPAVLLYVGIGVGFTVLYVLQGATEVQSTKRVPVVELGLNMVAKALVPGLLGGPWRWLPLPPDALADPPVWAWLLSSGVAAVVVTSSLVRRTRAGRAWVFAVLYMVVMVALVAQGRAFVVGPAIGLVYRYLTDGVPLAVLVLGLAFAELRGAVESSAPRPAHEHHAAESSPARPARESHAVAPGTARRTHRARVGLAGRLVPVLLAGVLVGCGYSTMTYVPRWHSENQGRTYFAHVQGDAERLGPVPIADNPVPATIILPFSYPENMASRILAPAGIALREPEVSDRLLAIDNLGYLRQAVVVPQMRGDRKPDPKCQRLIGPGTSTTIRLGGGLFDPSRWWLRIGYIASRESPIVVRVDDRVVPTQVQPGLHAIFVHGNGLPREVELSGLATGVALCLGDDVTVGPVEPGML